MDGPSARAVIYARFSSDKQRMESIEDQVRVCRSYADGHGMEVVGTYSDEALSGTSDHRPEFLRMMDDAKRNTFNVVLVYKFDRFSRDRYDSAVYKHRLRSCGVRVVSATEWVPETPEGVLMESILEGYAEFYSKQLAQNVRRGMEGNARKCRTNGVRVFGYRTGPDGTYVAYEPEARVVREVFSRYVGGETLASILRDMQSRGVTNARGGRPTRQWLDVMVHNRRYVGEYRWGDVTVPGGMPAIVDPGLFAAAQGRGRGRHSADLAGVHPFPLTGRLFDRETGRPWSGTSGTSASGRTYWYYELRVGGETVRVPQARMEAACASAVRQALADVDRLRAAAEEAARLGNDDRAESAARKEMADIDRRQANILKAVESGITPDGLQARIDELRARRQALEAAVRRSGHGFEVAEAMRALSRIDALASDAEVCALAVRYAETDRADGSIVVRLATEGPDGEPPPGVRVTPSEGAPLFSQTFGRASQYAGERARPSLPRSRPTESHAKGRSDDRPPRCSRW